MLSKLKDNISGKRSEQLSVEISETKKLHKEQASKISDMQEDLETVKSYLKELTENQKNMLKENKAALELSGKLKEELEESTTAIKIMSSTIQNNLVRKITDEITSLTRQIADKLSGSERLKKEIEQVSVSVKDELKTLKEDEHFAETPVVILTNLTSKEAIEKAHEFKNTNYLIKVDNSLNDLTQKVQEILS